MKILETSLCNIVAPHGHEIISHEICVPQNKLGDNAPDALVSGLLFYVSRYHPWHHNVNTN